MDRETREYHWRTIETCARQLLTAVERRDAPAALTAAALVARDACARLTELERHHDWTTAEILAREG